MILFLYRILIVFAYFYTLLQCSTKYFLKLIKKRIFITNAEYSNYRVLLKAIKEKKSMKS